MIFKAGMFFAMVSLVILPGYHAQISNLKSSFVGISSITLTWDKLDGASSYTINYYKSPQTRKEDVIENVPSNTYTLGNLESGTTYSVFVTANAAESTRLTFLTKGPKPVTNFNFNGIYARKVDIEWVPNETQLYDGFYIIVVQVISTNEKKEISPGIRVEPTVTKYTIENLQPASGYRIDVIGTYKNENSSMVGRGVGTAAELLPPTNLKVTDQGVNDVLLNWVIPPGDGITYYEIEYKMAVDGAVAVVIAKSNNVNQTTQKISDLTPETLYTVRMRSVAINTNNKGDWSPWISFSTLVEASLAAPQNVKVIDLGKDQATIGWDAVLGNNLKYYLVQYFEFQTRPIEPKQTTSTTFQLSLRSGTKYQVTVQAVSTSGKPGQISTALIFTTNSPKPVAPNPTITEITETGAKLSWITESGSEFDYVEVYLYNSVSKQEIRKTPTKDNATTSVIWNDLTSNTPFRVEIFTVKGNDKSSAVTYGFRTQISQKILQSQLSCTAKVSDLHEKLGLVDIQCTKLEGETVMKYKTMVKVKDNDWLTRTKFADILQHAPSTDLKFQNIQIQGLLSGYSYEIYVRPVFDGFINGTWTTAIQFNIPHGRPPSFVDVQKITDVQAEVAWTNPYEGDAAKKFDYRITYKSLQDNTITEKVSSVRYDQVKTLQLRDLLPNHRYQAAVSTTLDGETMNGTAITIGFRTRFGSPPSPAYPKVTITNSKATFSWELIPDRPDITGYEVLIDRTDGSPMRSGGSLQLTYRTESGRTNSFEFPPNDVTIGVQYRARVRALVTQSNEERTWLSEGAWSTLNHFVMATESGTSLKLPPTVKTSYTGPTDLVVQWQPINDVLRYEVEVVAQSGGPNGEQIVYTVSTSSLNTQATVRNLQPGQVYFYQVRAVGNNGDVSPWTARIQIVTPTKGSSNSSGLSSGVVAGIVIAVVLIFLIIVAGVIIMKKRQKAQFNRFGNSVQFSRNNDGGMNNGHAEMDDPAQTAIKKGNKLYV